MPDDQAKPLPRAPAVITAAAEAPPVTLAARLPGDTTIGFRRRQVPRDMAPPREAAEALLRVLDQIHLDLPERPCRVLLVTAAEPKAGVTTLGWWLTLLLAAGSEEEILYLDAGRPPPDAVPSLPGLFEAEPRPERVISLMQATPVAGLHRMRGRTPGSQRSLPGTRVAAALGQLRRRFGWVVIDADPPALSPLTLALAGLADGALLVVDPTAVGRGRAERAADSLRAAGGRLVGAVLNRAGG